MPRLIFVNRFFHPDHSATSQLLGDLTFHLAEAGFDVHVVTSRQIYDDASRDLSKHESVRGVQVHRVWATRFGRGRLLLRAVDYLTFYLSAMAKLARLARSGTVVIAETDPPLLSVPSAAIARLSRASLINWTQDLFPEIAENLGVPGIALVAPLLRRLRNFSLRSAHTNVVLSEGMGLRVRGEGIAEDKIEVIHNWSPVETGSPSALTSANPLREEWGLGRKFVVGYSGNFGRAHDFATVLDAAAALRDLPHVHFLFVGAGAQRAWLQEHVATLGLSNVSFRPYQPLDRLALSLSVPDVHLVSLKPELEGLIVPSKFYAVLAAGRPVLFVGNATGEMARQIEDADCGRAFAAGAPTDLAAAIRDLAGRPDQVAKMGERARALWAARFQRKHALAAWQALVTRVSAGTKG
jgi:glycosyltransferase involved in cell wall biosynthesis